MTTLRLPPGQSTALAEAFRKLGYTGLTREHPTFTKVSIRETVSEQMTSVKSMTDDELTAEETALVAEAEITRADILAHREGEDLGRADGWQRKAEVFLAYTKAKLAVLHRELEDRKRLQVEQSKHEARERKREAQERHNAVVAAGADKRLKRAEAFVRQAHELLPKDITSQIWEAVYATSGLDESGGAL